jgi:hypothetical protein
MADTNHHAHDSLPIEGDGVHYSGIGWFLVILVVTVVASQLTVWGLFEFSAWRVAKTDAPRAPLAAEADKPTIEGGRLVRGTANTPAPALLVNEPMVLQGVRTAEEQALTTYGWVNEAGQVVRLPIARAKDLAVERGFPVRGAVAATPAAAK